MAKFIPETEATQPDLDLVEPGCAVLNPDHGPVR